MNYAALSPDIQGLIRQKGFYVYSYISLQELISTVRKDYLVLLSKINIPFAIATVIVMYLAFETNSYPIVIWFFLCTYGGIMAYLLLRLIYRTKKYFEVSNVVFTEAGIIIGKKIFSYSKPELDEAIDFYDTMFEEYLTKPSRLKDIIEQKEAELMRSTSGFFEKAGELTRHYNARKRAGITMFVWLALAVYSLLLVLFYFLGIGFGYIFFGMYALIIISIMYLSKSIELRIKRSVENIDQALERLQQIGEIITKKITRFTDGNIEDVSQSIGEKFSSFYQTVHHILKHQKQLKSTIENSPYSKLIDFHRFQNYLTFEYNKPINSLLAMLRQSQYSLRQNLAELNAHHPDQAEHAAHFEQKKLRTQEMLQTIESNIQQIELVSIK